MGDFLCPYSIVAVACGMVGSALGARREAGAQGFILGLVFGPFGLIAACLVDGRGLCTECREPLGQGAKICGHCGAKYERPFGSATAHL